MPDTITLAGRPVSLSGDPIKVHGKVITPNGLADAVFEGGGAKGFGQVGALAFAEEIGIRWVNIAGTSAGAIVASLLAAGYTPTEITEIMGEIDFRKFMDESLLDRLPLFLGKAMSIVFQKGVFEGRYFSKTIAKYLARRNVRTFRDLVIPEFANDPRYRYRLRVVASDISRGKMLVLPQDIVDYGLAPDDLSVAAALRMSMSIPFVFEPVKQRLPGGEVCYIVDGGLLSNYPVHLFDEEGTPAWPTFGFMMKEPSEERLVPHRIRGPITMGMATFNTMFFCNGRPLHSGNQLGPHHRHPDAWSKNYRV